MPDAEGKSAAFLESSVKNFRIFIDTCSLLSEHAEQFWANIVPILQREGKTVVIPLRVCEEVKKFADDPVLCAKKEDPFLNQRAKAALSRIVSMQKAHVIEVFGEQHDNFADNVFQTVFTQFRLKYNLMLITQDHNLASDIIAIGKSKAVNTSNHILVERINRYGYLSTFNFRERSSSGRQKPRSMPHPLGEMRGFQRTNVLQLPPVSKRSKEN